MFKRICFIGFLFLSTSWGWSQAITIHGKVTDATGAVIPGVLVTIVDTAGHHWEVTTDSYGNFERQSIPAGDVEVSAALPGFQTWTMTISAGEKPVQEILIVLQVASVAESVEVSTSVGRSLSASTSSTIQQRNRVLERRPNIVNRGRVPMNTESYDFNEDNRFITVSDEPRSTFALDVDTASYANVRRFLNSGEMPPKDAVRIEELVNYFTYNYTPPSGPDPVAILTEVAAPFWQPTHRLVKIAIRATDISTAARKPANLVFLIDVSGSMSDDDKLPLVQRALTLLVDHLKPDDRVAMVVYAGSSGLVLPSTRGEERDVIRRAINRLEAGGSTNGGEGIELAYRIAAENFVSDGINRVILATDGDFNVGVTSEGDLVRLIQKKAESGVFLSVLGFGIGNYKDSTLEKLADKGHGNYAYIDTFREAQKVLAEQLSGTLLTVAKDVKLQIEFNPTEVSAYRLIGYENRLLDDADFNNDAKQGGDMGSGQTVTAFFEVVPHGVAIDAAAASPLKYQENRVRQSRKGELLTVSLRYKQPRSGKSALIDSVVRDDATKIENAGTDFRFASAVAAFGMLLRNSPHKGSATFESVLDVGSTALTNDPSGYRAEFIGLVHKAQALNATSRPN